MAMKRRNFIKTSFFTGVALMNNWENLFAQGTQNPLVGKPWTGWNKGQFQVHFIYTGVAESIFMIFPDGTSMLLDCGDANNGGLPTSVPILPNSDRHSGEWIARYVLRVNPKGKEVDYMLLSHYHNDHGGWQRSNAGMFEAGNYKFALSGFSQAAQYLNFYKAIDRCWPDYNDPIPLKDKRADNVAHMKAFYNYMNKEKGLKIEKFELGAINQIALLNNPELYRRFYVKNICANGRVITPDGRILDLYKDYIKEKRPEFLNENGMSLGMVFYYGPFRFFTAGDFADQIPLSEGKTHWIENDLAKVCGTAHVTKLNHHGLGAMPQKLIEALRSQVYVSCVWGQKQDADNVMTRVASRTYYNGDRIICPTIMPAERRTIDGDKKWMKDVAKASYEGGHVVLNVEEGGEKYSITYLSAADESMTVKSVMNFETKEL